MENKDNAIKTIEEGVEEFSMGHVTKRKGFGYIGLLWLALGIAAFIAQSFDKENGTLTMVLLIAGMCLVSYGIIKFFVKKEQYLYDGRPMKMHEFMFDLDRFNDVMRLYNDGKFSDMLEISRSSAAKMKLKILVDNNYTVAFSQIYKFDNYDFAPAAPIRAHDKAQCMNINTLVISY